MLISALGPSSDRAPADAVCLLWRGAMCEQPGKLRRPMRCVTAKMRIPGTVLLAHRPAAVNRGLRAGVR